MIRRPLVLGTLIAIAMLAAGCSSDPTAGYAIGTSFDRDIETIHVPIFANDTYTRGIEVLLTDAIIKEIQARTPWRVTGARQAQVVLSGEIIDVELRRLSTARTSGLTQEQGVGLTLAFELRETGSDDVVLSRSNFAATEAFIPSQGLQERLEFGQHAVIREIARDVVSELRSNW